MRKIDLVCANQQDQARVPPLLSEDNRTDISYCMDAEIRDSFQKLGLTGYNKAKLYNRALQGTLAHVKQNHRITESQNSRGWKGPLWVI